MLQVAACSLAEIAIVLHLAMCAICYLYNQVIKSVYTHSCYLASISKPAWITHMAINE